MSHTLGVDAGGSQTRARVWNAARECVAEAESGPGNPGVVGVELAGDAIEHACAQVLALAGVHGRELGGAVLGIAGTGRAGLPLELEDRIETWGLAGTVIVSDLELAAAAGLQGEPGLHVVAGTGSALWLRSDAGEGRPMGGWGWALGDEGSGFALGLRALRRGCRGADREIAEDPLSARLRHVCGFEVWADVIEWLREPARRRPEVAALSRLVLDAAEAGEDGAREIVRAELGALAELIAEGIAAGEFLGEPRLSGSGGLFARPSYETGLREELARRGVTVRWGDFRVEPLEGAFTLLDQGR